MPFISADQIAASYDLVVVGSGFGSLFFTHKALLVNPKLRVLMLERGALKTYEEQIAAGRNSDIKPASTFENLNKKAWNFTIGFGGGTNCWYGQTPRMHPTDFQTKTLYGVGQDWPFSYDELETYYCEAEEIMQIAGPDDLVSLFPRSKPYPQPPHRLSTIDEIMKRAQPDSYFAAPAARATRATKTRSPCCATSRCWLCPTNAKFTVFNGFPELIANPALSIVTEAPVTQLEIENNTVRRALFSTQAGDREVRGDLFVMGANAIHSPAILLASGLDTPLTGVGLNEQVPLEIEVFLDGLDNFDGGTIIAGMSYALTYGDFRKDYGGAQIYFSNYWRWGVRREYGRWRQTLPLVVWVEDPPSEESRISVDAEGGPRVRFPRYTDYAQRGIAVVREKIPGLLAPLPVEAIVDLGYQGTESHLQGTLRLGRTIEDSVVDATQVHHKVRNLVVVGSSVMPTCPLASPSLVTAALSLRAADRIIGRA
jgi:choline dehydrogenase-like flavoprotein